MMLRFEGIRHPLIPSIAITGIKVLRNKVCRSRPSSRSKSLCDILNVLGKRPIRLCSAITPIGSITSSRTVCCGKNVSFALFGGSKRIFHLSLVQRRMLVKVMIPSVRIEIREYRTARRSPETFPSVELKRHGFQGHLIYLGCTFTSNRQISGRNSTEPRPSFIVNREERLALRSRL